MKKLLLIFSIIFITTSASAFSNLIINNYTSENGLPHNTVFSQVKDGDGFMWFGTWYGLTSFDGVKFRSYSNREDYNADIPPHKIQNVVEANDGNLWVKTIDHKLYLFDKKTELYFDVFNVIKDEYTVSPKFIKIQREANGNLLILTKNRDLLLAKSLGNGKIQVELLHNTQTKRAQRQTSNLLFEDKRHISWVGLDFKILSVVKGKAFGSKPSDYILQKISLGNSQQFTCSALDKNKLWIGDNSGGIFKIDINNSQISRINTFSTLGAITNIAVNNSILYVTVYGKGIFEYNELTNQAQKILNPVTFNISESFIDSYDKVWFVLNQSTLFYYDPLNKSSRQFKLETGDANRSFCWQDGKELGMFFLSTSGDAYHFDRTTLSFTSLTSYPGFTKSNERLTFFNLLLDKDNILWLSSTNFGVFRISFPVQQFNLLHPSGNSFTQNKSVKSLQQTRNGDIWVAYRNAEVYQLNKYGAVKQVYNNNSFNIGSVYHMMEDSRGNIWFSTKGNGVVLAEPDPKSRYGFRFSRYTYDEENPNSLSGNDVYYTYEDSKNRVWIALFGGGLNLTQWQQGKLTFKNKFNSFEKYPGYGLYMEVRNIAEDKEGRLWVGTSDGLLSFPISFTNPDKIDFEIYRNETANSNVSDNDIYVLYKDSEQDLWAGVFGGGINKLTGYDEKKHRPIFKQYSNRTGLKSNVILSIIEDNSNGLWLATENAISRFDKKTETFRNYDRYDGFMDMKMEEESAVRLQSGELLFGTRNGILSFDPKKIETYNCNYQTFIVDFKVSNRDLNSFTDDPILKSSIKYANSITLKHNQSNFVVEFAALNYYNQNRVSYRYILEGYEEEWHYNGKNRFATYPNVPHGTYLLRIQAIDEANIDLKSERTLEIIILPPWWLSWWMKIVYTLLFLGLAYLTVRGILFYMRMRNEMYVEQRVSELKIRFFTNISHELRTPLTLIMGPVQELKQKQSLSEKGLQYVSMIEKNANQMLQLVNQILDFRKIQNGKMVLNVSHLQLNSVIDSFHKEFSILAEESGIKFVFRLSPEDIFVWADKEKLEIVIRNILSNAFKFTHKGGTITVYTGYTSQKDKCYISIEDTGVGIPQNKLSEIFERFFQGDNYKNVQSPGTGIGLALSKEIVNLHHGEIHAESKQGQGTVFTVELQLNKDHFNPKEVNFYVGDTVSNESESSQLSSETPEDENDDNKNELPVLLVVEDNKDLCNLLRMQLEDKYKVYTAGNGVEGLKKVKQHHPDIVVTDQMMPEMTGTEMMTAMRNDFNISHIPVIILTAKTDDEAKLNAINLGANAYITKPFNKEYLVARIEQLLGDRKSFREKVWKQEKTEQPAVNETYENYLQEKDVEFLDKIHRIIEENIDNSEFNIDSIADTIGISRSAFFKKLKSLTGLAPVDTIKEVRLTKSLELLRNTDLTVSEVAYAVGFKESGYYGKCFRKKYNQTPTEYMNKYRKL